MGVQPSKEVSRLPSIKTKSRLKSQELDRGAPILAASASEIAKALRTSPQIILTE
jgi:hypothetical protein